MVQVATADVSLSPDGRLHAGATPADLPYLRGAPHRAATLTGRTVRSIVRAHIVPRARLRANHPGEWLRLLLRARGGGARPRLHPWRDPWARILGASDPGVRARSPLLRLQPAWARQDRADKLRLFA